MNIQETLAASRIIPVVVIDDPERAVPLARTLLKGGLKTIEITFRTAAAAESIQRIAAEVPEMVIGAGTLLTPDQAESAKMAGAHFGVAPGFDPEVVRRAQLLEWPFVPGISTASELSVAIRMGCMTAKFFPARDAGGPAMLKSLIAAFRHTGVKFMPTGGIGASTIGEWLAIPEVLAAGGSWMVEGKLIRDGDWGTIEQLTREAVASLQGAVK